MGTDVFEHNRINANGISIHTVSIGDGPMDMLWAGRGW
jgi:hypothetical protein